MPPPSSPIIRSRPVQPHAQLNCPHCSRLFEYPIPSSSSSNPNSPLNIQCCFCEKVTQHSPGRSSVGNGAGNGGGKSNGFGAKKGGRKIGTQEKPLETGYYDTLGIAIDATDEEIKKAYRRLAIKHHPDKNRDDPGAEEKFKEIGIAYQTLIDPTLRRKYNEFGPKESAPEGGYVDPEEIFGAIFGGERFVPIIGEISLARDMKSAMQEAEDEEENQSQTVEKKDGKKVLTEEERKKKEEKDRARAAKKAAEREQRVSKLVSELERKLSIFTESATGIPYKDKDVTQSWRTICQLEADELKKESYGVDLLHTIGFVYTSKARHHIASNQSLFGMGGWLHNVQGKYHVFSETVSTVRAAIELKSVFDQIQAAEKNGSLTEAERKKLEESAAEKGLQTLFKGAKLEIESVLRETCDRILTPSPSPNPPAVPPKDGNANATAMAAYGNHGVSKEKVMLRAIALQIIGEAYMSVKKEGGLDGVEGVGDGYVRVDVSGKGK